MPEHKKRGLKGRSGYFTLDSNSLGEKLIKSLVNDGPETGRIVDLIQRM